MLPGAKPSYLSLYESGELHDRARKLHEMLRACRVCPHECGVDRTRGEIGICHSGPMPIVSAYVPHFGEEPALVGTGGVGNIFFGNCNLRCVYCQNHQISQNWREEADHAVTLTRLAEIMIELQRQGCHSVGLVSAGHFVPQIVGALLLAVEMGFNSPLIYNTNAYDSVETLRLLDGVVDIYLPDLKYSDEATALEFSGVRRYPERARAAIREMHRQVGPGLVYGQDGVIRRGMIIRHLVLPNDLAGSRDSLKWVRDELGAAVALSIMSQYYPAHRAGEHLLLNRPVREREYERVLDLVERLGFENGWAQEFDSRDHYRPDFSDRARPFSD